MPHIRDHNCDQLGQPANTSALDSQAVAGSEPDSERPKCARRAREREGWSPAMRRSSRRRRNCTLRCEALSPLAPAATAPAAASTAAIRDGGWTRVWWTRAAASAASCCPKAKATPNERPQLQRRLDPAQLGAQHRSLRPKDDLCHVALCGHAPQLPSGEECGLGLGSESGHAQRNVGIRGHTRLMGHALEILRASNTDAAFASGRGSGGSLLCRAHPTTPLARQLRCGCPSSWLRVPGSAACATIECMHDNDKQTFKRHFAAVFPQTRGLRPARRRVGMNCRRQHTSWWRARFPDDGITRCW